jgi:DMSO/TMAO reductase YedYZ molybdopterin-dependent catalytic subunit
MPKHRYLGGALLLLLLWAKLPIARASLRRRLPRRDPSLAWGLLTATTLLAVVGLGLAWTFHLVSFDTFWGYSAMNVHTALGIAVLPILLPHAVARFRSNRGVGLQPVRRATLRLLGLAVGGVLLGGPVLQTATAALAGAAGARLPSGSKHAGSFNGNAHPQEIWLLDSVPSLDGESWRLDLSGRLDAPGQFGLAELAALPQRQLQAVLDCTGGWWTEQVWSGPRLGDLLAERGLSPAAAQVAVTSVTGHRIVLPLAELGEALLATHVGGEPLLPGHGYPVRLAIGGRRGYHWVKWVSSVEVM